MKTTDTKPSAAKDDTINQGTAYAWPMGVWLFIFFIAPLVIIFVYSFLKKGLYGGVEWEFSLAAYRRMFNPNYGILVLRTLKITTVSTALTVLISIPCGYAMARSRHQTFLLFLIIIP